jgi:MFS family permease
VLRVLRHPDFALAWSGGLISMIGTWALWIALPIQVYELSGSALATSAVVAAVVVPGVLLGSVAGIFVDRWNRRTTLIVTNLLLAASVLPLLLVGESTLWLGYPVILVSATLSQFSEPAENAFLPRLVPSDDLIAANSLNAWNNNLARLVGPALGGGLYAATGLTGVVLADAASFLAVAVLLAFVRTSGAVDRTADAAAAFWSRRRAWHEWREGLGVVAGERAVGVVFAVQAITAVGEGVFGVMFVVWVRDVLEGGAPELGWLQTSQAVGGLLGGFLSVYVGKRLVPERSFGLALVAFGVFDLLLFNYPLFLTGVWIGSALMILVGIPTASVYAARTTILQTHVEDAYRGRVFGSLGTTAALLTLVGTGIAGAMGDVLGPIALLNIQGSAYVVAGLFALIALAPRFAAARAVA